MTKHTDLIAMLEALTGPDREVDARIWCLFAGVKYKGHFLAYGDPTRTQVEFTLPPKRTRCVTSDAKGYPHKHAAHVTASLDAAVALCERVLPGYLWSLSIHETGTAIAHVDTDWEGSFPRYHAIPAIALLIATLKAIDEQEDADDK